MERKRELVIACVNVCLKATCGVKCVCVSAGRKKGGRHRKTQRIPYMI